MMTLVWQALVTGAIAAVGFGLYMKLTKGADLPAMLRPALMVGGLAALISLVVRVIF